MGKIVCRRKSHELPLQRQILTQLYPEQRSEQLVLNYAVFPFHMLIAHLLPREGHNVPQQR